MIEKVKSIGTKKIIIIASFFITIIIIIMGGAFLYNKFFYKRSFAEIEDIMVKATEKYLSKNPDNLPKSLNGTVTISATDLSRTNDMKPISEYLKDDSINCTGNVNVTNINGAYRYTPDLDCNDKYKTTKFINYIKKNIPIVETGNGLYNLNNELVFRGDQINNYLKLADKTYRIVKFTNDEAVIILTEKSNTYMWDNRYNVEKKANLGINDYSVSKIRTYLNELYQNDNFLKKDSNGIDSKKLVIAYNLEVGKRSENDTDKSGSLEKAVIIENQFIGLLPAYDYMNASLDTNCNKTSAPSCMNYNYLIDFGWSWWSNTANSTNTYKAFKIDSNAYLANANNKAQIRPVLHITKDALYVSGDGSKNNPYIIK